MVFLDSSLHALERRRRKVSKFERRKLREERSQKFKSFQENDISLPPKYSKNNCSPGRRVLLLKFSSKSLQNDKQSVAQTTSTKSTTEKVCTLLAPAQQIHSFVQDNESFMQETRHSPCIELLKESDVFYGWLPKYGLCTFRVHPARFPGDPYIEPLHGFSIRTTKFPPVKRKALLKKPEVLKKDAAPAMEEPLHRFSIRPQDFPSKRIEDKLRRFTATPESFPPINENSNTENHCLLGKEALQDLLKNDNLNKKGASTSLSKFGVSPSFMPPSQNSRLVSNEGGNLRKSVDLDQKGAELTFIRYLVNRSSAPTGEESSSTSDKGKNSVVLTKEIDRKTLPKYSITPSEFPTTQENVQLNVNEGTIASNNQQLLYPFHIETDCFPPNRHLVLSCFTVNPSQFPKRKTPPNRKLARFHTPPNILPYKKTATDFAKWNNIEGYKTRWRNLRSIPESKREVTFGSTVKVHIRGSLTSGEVFWDTHAPGEKPYIFVAGMGNIVKGLSISIVGMKEKEIREILVASSEGYGALGFAAWNIPPNSVRSAFHSMNKKCRTCCLK